VGLGLFGKADAASCGRGVAVEGERPCRAGVQERPDARIDAGLFRGLYRLLGDPARRLVERDQLVGVERECVAGEAGVTGFRCRRVAAPVVVLRQVVPPGIERGPSGLL
jgi:hypothetical protein